MPSIQINGVRCEYEPGQTILQVANRHGVKIPYYCYHDALSIPAQCRICLGELWAPNPRNDNKLEPMMGGKLQPTTKTALDRMWTVQKPTGEWNWLKCDWPPYEHDDYYGAVFAALGVGLAPEGYAKTQEATRDGDKRVALAQGFTHFSEEGRTLVRGDAQGEKRIVRVMQIHFELTGPVLGEG